MLTVGNNPLFYDSLTSKENNGKYILCLRDGILKQCSIRGPLQFLKWILGALRSICIALCNILVSQKYLESDTGILKNDILGWNESTTFHIKYSLTPFVYLKFLITDSAVFNRSSHNNAIYHRMAAPFRLDHDCYVWPRVPSFTDHFRPPAAIRQMDALLFKCSKPVLVLLPKSRHAQNNCSASSPSGSSGPRCRRSVQETLQRYFHDSCEKS